MRQFCEFPGFDNTNEESVRYLTRLVDFFTSDYLDVLESAQYHTIYHYDVRWPKLSGLIEDSEHHDDIEEESDSEEEEEIARIEEEAEAAAAAGGAVAAVDRAVGGPTAEGPAGPDTEGPIAGRPSGRAAGRAIHGHGAARIVAGHIVAGRPLPPGYVSKATAWRELTEKTNMNGFDHVSAVSQAAINEQYKTMWTVAQNSKNAVDATLARWSYEQFFSSSFQPITLRLLSNNRAIVWIHLQDGWLKTLKNWLPWGE